MELRHLRYFVAVAEELHFGRAALRVRVAQPALSQQIQQLERELGVLLLNRTKRQTSLTEPGAAFLLEARRTLAAAEGAVTAARRAESGQVGRLRVGYVDWATWLLFPAILRTYRQRFPAVAVSLTELHHEAQREALVGGELDVGLFSLQPDDPGVEGALVAVDHLVAALPQGHPLAQRTRVPLAALSEEPWVLFPRELKTYYTELILESCRQAGFVPRIAQEAGQLHTLSGLVAAGVGVTLLPNAIAKGRRAGVAFRPLAGKTPRLPLHVVWREGELGSTARCFVEIAREVSGRFD